MKKFIMMFTLLSFLSSTTVHAGSFVPMSPQKMVDDSDIVIMGKVESITTYMNGKPMLVNEGKKKMVNGTMKPVAEMDQYHVVNNMKDLRTMEVYSMITFRDSYAMTEDGMIQMGSTNVFQVGGQVPLEIRAKELLTHMAKKGTRVKKGDFFRGQFTFGNSAAVALQPGSDYILHLKNNGISNLPIMSGDNGVFVVNDDDTISTMGGEKIMSVTEDGITTEVDPETLRQQLQVKTVAILGQETPPEVPFYLARQKAPMTMYDYEAFVKQCRTAAITQSPLRQARYQTAMDTMHLDAPIMDFGPGRDAKAGYVPPSAPRFSPENAPRTEEEHDAAMRQGVQTSTGPVRTIPRDIQ